MHTDPPHSCAPSSVALGVAQRGAVRGTAVGAMIVGAIVGAAGAQAQSQAQPSGDVHDCVGIADDGARLACYDRAAGRALPPAAAPELPPSPLETPAQAAAEPPAAARSDSLLSRYWELDDEDKRGKLNYTAYRPNFFLPAREMQRVDNRPYSPTRGVATNLPDFQHFEAEFQVSMRTKILQDIGLPGADLWAAYTQQSMWQLWNSSQSAPFRDTDYQPELIYVVPTPAALQSLPLGWTWRMAQLALVHQSNGQADPLSRSWNRVYAGFGLERGSVIATLRVERRLDTGGGPDNDNPDITHYLGRGEAQLSWAPGRSIATLRWRPSFVGLGSVQLDWSYPIVDSVPDGARWFVRLFEGYGETLLDYNFRQASIGAGVAIFKF